MRHLYFTPQQMIDFLTKQGYLVKEVKERMAFPDYYETAYRDVQVLGVFTDTGEAVNKPLASSFDRLRWVENAFYEVLSRRLMEAL